MKAKTRAEPMHQPARLPPEPPEAAFPMQSVMSVQGAPP